MIETVVAGVFDFKTGILLMFLISFIIRAGIIIVYYNIQQNSEFYTVKISPRLRKFLNLSLSTILIFVDPVVFVINSRKKDKDPTWNKYKDFKIFILFTLSTLICTLELASVIYPSINLLRFIF